MIARHSLSTLPWTLTGWTPYLWRVQRAMETGKSGGADIPPIPAPVPGSVQQALRAAGHLPEWTIGLQSRDCEWVENRHWVYAVALPDRWLESGRRVRLHCLGLDYSGWVLVNGQDAGTFRGAFRPHEFDLTPFLRDQGNTVRIVFDLPPRWLGQFGATSTITDWKPRFNYTWDWMPRLVQTGIWDDVELQVSDGTEIAELVCTASLDAGGQGALDIRADVWGAEDARVQFTLTRGERVIREEARPAADLQAGIHWDGLAVEPWWPNGAGPQPLYTLRCRLLDRSGAEQDMIERRMGFKNLRWEQCEGAPAGADPWLCVINGRPIFLQGVNWTPIRANFADVTGEQYRQRLVLYQRMGCNILRVWGGAGLEKEIFSSLCDGLGLLVWQEFPLSSSGLDNWPPEDPAVIAELGEIARSYIVRRRHHVSCCVWCGGNELQGSLDGDRVGSGKPVDATHPLIAHLARIVTEMDPTHRFLPTSSSGPRFMAAAEDFGKGLHWDVHGPWQAVGDLEQEWTQYWEHDDALFRSETGAPGASPAALIEQYRGTWPAVPGTTANPLWNRVSWWIEWAEFVREHGREPGDLGEYVTWSRQRQARALAIAARACKERFPRCGGLIIWMGHDGFPCPTNTAIVDFHGEPKPAVAALAAIFR
jgi:beta-mannosidase